MELMDEGFNVKATKPKPDEDESTYIPTYWVPIIVKYDSEWPPKIYLVSGDADPVLLDEETVGDIDDAYVLNVNVELSRYYNKRNDRLSLYVKTMYVEQDIDNDPFARRYVRN